jgi:hypothetical protein
MNLRVNRPPIPRHRGGEEGREKVSPNQTDYQMNHKYISQNNNNNENNNQNNNDLHLKGLCKLKWIWMFFLNMQEKRSAEL